MSDTVEFYLPPHGTDWRAYLAAGDIIGIHHLARYEWASRVIRDATPRTVIDIACGSGYGTEMLAAASPSSDIRGADYDVRAVSYAEIHRSGPNLRFTTGDLNTWKTKAGNPLGDSDVIVSFDTIEHVAHRDMALLNISRHLASNGFLLFSTPCAHKETVFDPEWHHHKLEWCYTDLLDLMRRFFRRVLQPSDEAFPHQVFWYEEVNGGTSYYPTIGNPLVCREPIR